MSTDDYQQIEQERTHTSFVDMANAALRYLSNVSLRSRYYQALNGAIELALGSHLDLIYVVEYPRCGGTWFRHLLQTYLQVPQYAFDRIITRGTIVQLHRLYQKRMKRAVVVVRDPRDMFVSQYYKYTQSDRQPPAMKAWLASWGHSSDRDKREDFAGFLAAHFSHPFHPRFQFAEFLDSWSSRENVYQVRYEDLKSNTALTLREALAFLEIDCNDSRLTQTVEINSFENRTKARSGVSRQPGEEDCSQFERKGIVGDWENLFNEHSCELMQSREGNSLIRLGYTKDDTWIDKFLSSALIDATT